MGAAGHESPITAHGQAGHRSVHGEQWYRAALVSLELYSFLFVISFLLLLLLLLVLSLLLSFCYCYYYYHLCFNH